MRFPVITVSFLPATGMALFPFILVKYSGIKTDKIIINHEKIHLRQQLEMLILPFYIIYLLNYSVNLLYYRKHDLAYRNISFEREAYSHDSNLDYLSKRKFWAWLCFVA